MRDDNADAEALREAAAVLRSRTDKQTFAIRVIIRTLERSADRIEQGKGRRREPG